MNSSKRSCTWHWWTKISICLLVYVTISADATGRVITGHPWLPRSVWALAAHRRMAGRGEGNAGERKPTEAAWGGAVSLQMEWARQLLPRRSIYLHRQPRAAHGRAGFVSGVAKCVAASRLGFGMQIPNYWLEPLVPNVSICCARLHSFLIDTVSNYQTKSCERQWGQTVFMHSLLTRDLKRHTYSHFPILCICLVLHSLKINTFQTCFPIWSYWVLWGKQSR